MENNNQYQIKLELAKKLLKSNTEDIKQAQEFIDKAEEKYIGKALEQEIRRWTEDKEERQVMVEALEHLVWELENFLRQDADITNPEGVETTETKVVSELLNQQ